MPVPSARAPRPVAVWYTAVWTVFIAVPIALILTISDADWMWRAIGIAASLAFGVAWVRAVLRLSGGLETGQWAPRAPGAGELALALLPLVGLAALAVPAIGSGANAFAPFLASAVLFALPLRPGLIATAVLVIGMATWTMLEAGTLFAPQFMGPGIGIGFIVFGRVIAGMTEREERARLELAAVHEREEISRDIHDILGHTLTVVALKSQLARRTARSDPDRAEAELDEVLRLTQTALDDVRATVGRLRTPDLAAQVEAARLALADAGVDVVVRGDWTPLDPSRRALAAWAVREATTNILRHASAAECALVFSADGVEIVDDGVGIADAGEGHGLTGLRRRVADSGGELVVEPVAGGGTRVEVRFR